MLLTRCVLTTTFNASLSQGVDDGVKTIYYPPRRSKELNRIHRVQGHIVNRRLTTASTQPVTGSCAFVCAAMSFIGVCGGHPHAQHLAALKRPQRGREDEDQVHPGEGGA